MTAQTQKNVGKKLSIDPILRLPEVVNVTGLSRSTIYSFIKGGKFPAPIELGERSRGWRQSAVSDWIESRKEVTR